MYTNKIVETIYNMNTFRKLPSESFRWTATRYLNPITRSNSPRKAWKPSSDVKSYPAANAWQVSMQTPTRDWSKVNWMMEASSERSPPMVWPCLHIFSRTTATLEPLVCSWTQLMLSAMFWMLSSRDIFPHVEPAVIPNFDRYKWLKTYSKVSIRFLKNIRMKNINRRLRTSYQIIIPFFNLSITFSVRSVLLK